MVAGFQKKQESGQALLLIFQASACIMLTNVPFSKVSHMSKPRATVEGVPFKIGEFLSPIDK